TRFGSPFADQLANVVLELSCGTVGSRGRLDRDVELVHLHHAVRPVEQVAMAVEWDAEHPADDGDRVRLRVVVEQLHLAGFGQRLEQLARQVVCRLAERFDTARREGGGNELPQASVIRRLEPEQAPALRVPEGLPARIERRAADRIRREHVTEITTEPPVAETAPHVAVAGYGPTPAPGAVQAASRAAQGGQIGIRIQEEIG